MSMWSSSPTLSPLLPSAWAAAWRTGNATLSGWREFAEAWRERVFDDLAPAMAIAGNWTSANWAMPQSMVQYLIAVDSGTVPAPSERLRRKRQGALLLAS
eukprot:1059997-Pyramimonas_sp.AAC.1